MTGTIAPRPPDNPLVYVAGPLSGTHLKYIQNLHRMLMEAEFVSGLGLTPFIPGVDFLFAVFIVSGSGLQQQLYGMSAAILRRLNPERDCIYVYAYSPGVRMELELAKELGIPIMRSRAELKAYAASR